VAVAQGLDPKAVDGDECSCGLRFDDGEGEMAKELVEEILALASVSQRQGGGMTLVVRDRLESRVAPDGITF
jgi:hypothetical protein